MQEGFRHFTGAAAPGAPGLWTIIYRPVMQFWFLYVLFLLLVLYAVWRKAGGSWKVFVAVAFALNISLAFGVGYGSWGVIYQMWIYIPYLALGVLFSALVRLEQVDECGVPALVGLALGGYFAIAVAAFFHATGIAGLVVLLASAGLALGGYAAIAIAVFLGAAGLAGLVVPLAAAGILASVALAGCFSRWRPAAGIGALGVLSLEIFVAHTIFSSGFRQLLLAAGTRNAALHVAGGIAIGLAGPVILHALCKRFRLLFLFSLPSKRHA